MNFLGDVTLKLNPGTQNEVNFAPYLDAYEPQTEITYKRSFVSENGNERFSQPIRRQIVRFRLKPVNYHETYIASLFSNPVANWQYSTPLYSGSKITQKMRIVSLSPIPAKGTGILGTFYSGLVVTLRAVESDV